MKIKEVFANITAEGAQNYLAYIQSIDDTETIGDMRVFLTKRKQDAEAENKAKAEKLNQLKGKCFRIEYSPEHVQLLRIDNVETAIYYGNVDAHLSGEAVVSYKGDIRIESLRESSRWSNYLPCDKIEEITIEVYEQKKHLYKSIVL